MRVRGQYLKGGLLQHEKDRIKDQRIIGRSSHLQVITKIQLLYDLELLTLDEYNKMMDKADADLFKSEVRFTGTVPRSTYTEPDVDDIQFETEGL